MGIRGLRGTSEAMRLPRRMRTILRRDFILAFLRITEQEISRMSPTDRALYSAIAGFIAGIFLHSFVDFGGAFTVFIFFLGTLFFCLRFTKLHFAKSSETLGSLQCDPRSRHFKNVFRFWQARHPTNLGCLSFGCFLCYHLLVAQVVP